MQARGALPMPSNAFTFPLGFSWLSPADRPTDEEIDVYAAMIAAKEGMPRECADEFRREAELQLWVWHSETHAPPARARRRSRGNRVGFSVVAA